MERIIDKEKYEYIEVDRILNDLPRKEVPLGERAGLGGADFWESDIDSLGKDGWEMIYCKSSIIWGTGFSFRRPKNKKDRQQWEYISHPMYQDGDNWQKITTNRRSGFYMKRVVSENN